MDNSVKAAIIVAIIGGVFGIAPQLIEKPPWENHQPEIIDLTPTPPYPQADGTIITWTAKANDPEDDDIFYKFELSGPSTGDLYVDQQNWSTNSEWIWESDYSDIGTNYIRVWIKDEKHKAREIRKDYKIANKAMANGRIIYPDIKEMNLSETYTFSAYIARNDSIETAKRKITADSDVGEKSIPILNNSFSDTRRDVRTGAIIDQKSLKISPRMRADLKGDYTFRISRIYPDPPYILNISVDNPGHNYGLWLWSVTPTEKGTHHLELIANEVHENADVTFIESATIPIEVIVKTEPVVEEFAAGEPVVDEPVEAPKEEAEGIPGFEAIFAVTGLLAVAYLKLGRRK